jgi:hypothetical protein
MNLPPKTGCARWIGNWADMRHATQEATQKAISHAIRNGHWCNRTDGLKQYQVGPLCPEHQP